MSSTDNRYIRARTDAFYKSHISKFRREESEIDRQEAVKKAGVGLASFYQTREKSALQKDDFEVSLYDIEKVMERMHGSPSEKLFSQEMLFDLLKLHELVRDHLEEADKVADDIYVMF
jgi:hypothetical protein